MVPEEDRKTAPPGNLVILDEMVTETRKILPIKNLADYRAEIRSKLQSLQELQKKVPSDESLDEKLEKLWLQADDLLSAHFLD